MERFFVMTPPIQARLLNRIDAEARHFAGEVDVEAPEDAAVAEQPRRVIADRNGHYAELRIEACRRNRVVAAAGNEAAQPAGRRAAAGV